MQNIRFELPRQFESCLIGQDEIRTLVKDSKENRLVEMDVDVMKKVLEIRPDQWQSAMNFAKSRRMVSADELTALRFALQMPNKIPSAIQSKKLLVLLERLYGEGFKL